MTIQSTFKTTEFTIGDPSKLFEILRSKMYSDPIGSICREILCNARDAHREVGKEDLPCEVHFPIEFDPYLRIKDFGPGISPDRMENVYCKYTTTTKVGTNQTGGFGLGAKVGFAYTNSFNVITCIDGVKYNYVAFIDKSGLGAVFLLNSSATKDPNGTEIVIPIKSSDFDGFQKEVFKTIQFWDVKPNLYKNYKKIEVTYPATKTIVAGKDWEFYNSTSSRENKIIGLIDGIQYDLKTSKEFSWFKPLYFTLLIKINLSDITISSTRENLYYDDKTKDFINSKIDSIKKDIDNSIIAEIMKHNNVYDAVICAKIFKNNIKDIPNHIEINKVNIHNALKNIESSNFITNSFQYFFESKTANNSYSSVFCKNQLVIVDDILGEKPSRSKCASIGRKIPYSLLSKFNGNVCLVRPSVYKNTDVNKNLLTSVFDYKLSDFYKPKVKKITAPASKIVYFELVGSRFCCVAKSELPSKTENKIFVSLKKSFIDYQVSEKIIDKSKNISNWTIQNIAKSLGCKVYGTTADLGSKTKEIVGNFFSLEEAYNLAKSKLDEAKYKEYILANAEIEYIIYNSKIADFGGFLTKIKDYAESDFKLIENKLKDLIKIKDDFVKNDLYSDFFTVNLFVEQSTIDLVQNIINKYPMLYLINKENINKSSFEKLINYINFVNGK